MKSKIIFCILFMNLILFDIYSQECVSSFTSDLQNQIIVLKKREQRDIKKFMKIVYKVHPYYKLQEKNVVSIPIYSLFYNKRYQSIKKNVRNILCYIDTKRLYIGEIYFYKDSVFYGSAESAYSNFPDQPFGKSVFYIDLARIILKENPDMVFTIGQTNSYYLFLKDNQISVYARSSSKDTKYSKYILEDYINNHLGESDLILGYDYSPSIYSK